MACIEARGLRKSFGTNIALDGVNLRVEEGRILGLIGPNGAGKTTALNAILGLTPYQGELNVLGRDPWTERDQLMRDVCFISDVAVLPRWARVSQVLDYVAGVHPRFDRAKAEAFLTKTTIRRASKVRELSKGMVTQLHLALVMAIDAKLLVLDEPTLGLDILYRKQFYDSLLNDYFDRSRTIVVTTHQVEEIQHVLTDVMFINRGRIVFDCSMEELESRYLEVMVHPEQVAAARALKPMHERQVFGRSILLFDSKPDSQLDAADRGQLAALGDARTPSIADLFVAVIGNQCQPRTRSGAVNIPSSAMPGSPIQSVVPPAVISSTRLMYWSVRRELWENRSIYIAPLAVAALILFGFLISTIHLPDKMRGALDPMQRQELLEQPYQFAALLIMATSFVVAVFYCLDALHSERRDRSILFWKSLPVSDLTTVLSKASIPILVVPLVSFAITIATQWIMLLMSTAVLLGSGLSVATLWTRLPLFQMSLMLLYHLVAVHGLWYAPIYGWLLLVSGLGAARAISVGRLTAARDRRRREDCVQHFAFRRAPAVPLQRWRRS